MKKAKLIYLPLCVSLFMSCYHEVDLGDYRDDNGKNVLALNSLVCPDSTVQVSATRTYFFSDVHNGRTYVMGLPIELSVNGVPQGLMSYDEQCHLYMSTVHPGAGDRIQLSTKFLERDVEACDTVPVAPKIEKVEVKREGPMSIYSGYDFVVTYDITFTDRPGEANYYFLQWDADRSNSNVSMGERDFKREYVFNVLADRMHSTLPGWEPYCAYGLPFSDSGIDGKTHTLHVREILQMDETSPNWKRKHMNRVINLYSISKSYYEYLVSVLLNQTDDKGIQGGMIDLGIADPVKIYNNVKGGVGILGCYATDTYKLDVMKIIGEFPRR